MASSFPSLRGKLSAPIMLKGWQVIVATLGIVWLYRATQGAPSNYVLNWPGWLAWLLLTGILKSKAIRASNTEFPAVHNFARASAGAATLVALSSISLVQQRTASAWSLFILFTVTLGFYLVSCLVTGSRISKLAHDNNKGRSFTQSLDIWLPIGLAAVVVRDLRILRFAFWPARRSQFNEEPAPAPFSNHFVAKPMLIALLAIALVELAIGHILLRSTSPWIVFAHLAFGTIFVLYITGIIRSFAALPTVVETDVLRIRMSVFFEAVAPIRNIQTVSRIAMMPKDEVDSIANAAILVAPNILLEFSDEVEINRLFKGQSRVRAIALYVDDPETFISTLEAAKLALGVSISDTI